MFIKEPKMYITSCLELTDISWKFEGYGVEESYFENDLLYIEHNYLITKKTKLFPIIDSFVNFSLKSFLFGIRGRLALWIYLIFISLLLFISKKKYKYIIPIVYIILLWISLLYSIPFPFVRYGLPIIEITPFMLCLAIGIKKTTDK